MLGLVPRLKVVLCGLLVGLGVSDEEAYQELVRAEERLGQLEGYRHALGETTGRWAGIEDCFAAGTGFLREALELAAGYLETRDPQLLERACQSLGEAQTAFQDVGPWLEEAQREAALGVEG